MRVVIIEDEKPAALRLQKLIHELDPDMVVAAVLDSISSSISWFNQNVAPDLLFLDIQLADGKSFKIFESVEVEVPIIFTTAYDEFALQAFEHHCIDYLLKPIDKEKLKKSLAKINRLTSIGNTKVLDLLQSTLTKKVIPESVKRRFLIKGSNKLLSIKDEQIACFQSHNKIVVLVTHENRSFSVDQTLEELESSLDSELFFRLNRSVIINSDAIEHVEPGGNGKLIVETKPQLKQTFYVSRDRAKAFKQWLGG